MSRLTTMADTALGNILMNLAKASSEASMLTSDNKASLSRQTKTTRFEPLTLIDSDVSTYDGISDILNGVQHLFAGYLLQAISLYATVNNVSVLKKVERFNPQREADYSSLIRSVLSTGADLIGLSSESINPLPTNNLTLSLESMGSNKGKKFSQAYIDIVSKRSTKNPSMISIRKPTLSKEELSEDKGREKKSDEEEKKIEEKIDMNVSDSLNRASGISSGRFYDVNFTTDSGDNVTIPLLVKLIPLIVPSQRLLHLMTFDSKMETSFTERYFAWRSGRISSLLDLIFARDLIREQRKELIKDKDNLYKNLQDRRTLNNFASLITKSPSMASISNIIVISSTTAAELEKTLNIKLNNVDSRRFIFSEDKSSKVLNRLGLMFLVIIDKMADRVTIYTDGIKEPSVWTLREFRNARDSNVNVTEILKAYQLSSQPSSF